MPVRAALTLSSFAAQRPGARKRVLQLQFVLASHQLQVIRSGPQRPARALVSASQLALGVPQVPKGAVGVRRFSNYPMTVAEVGRGRHACACSTSKKDAASGGQS